jgi:hypothetical protein
MDYRHTEDFARRMEAAALQARHLRGEVVVQLWDAAGAALRAAGRAIRRRLLRSPRHRKLITQA